MPGTSQFSVFRRFDPLQGQVHKILHYSTGNEKPESIVVDYSTVPINAPTPYYGPPLNAPPRGAALVAPTVAPTVIPYGNYGQSQLNPGVTYTVSYTYSNYQGESTESPSASFTVPSAMPTPPQYQILIPPIPLYGTRVKVYVGTAGGSRVFAGEPAYLDNFNNMQFIFSIPPGPGAGTPPGSMPAAFVYPPTIPPAYLRWLYAGTLLSKITATGNYGPYDPAANDGRQLLTAPMQNCWLTADIDVTYGNVVIGAYVADVDFETANLLVAGVAPSGTVLSAIKGAFPQCRFW